MKKSQYITERFSSACGKPRMARRCPATQMAFITRPPTEKFAIQSYTAHQQPRATISGGIARPDDNNEVV